MKKVPGCTGKVKHKTKLAACITIKKMRHQALNAYQCSRCGGWHLGGSRSDYRQQKRIDYLVRH